MAPDEKVKRKFTRSVEQKQYLRVRTMPSVGRFRLFVRERLTAAAEEIFKVFEETLIEYEEEIRRQRSPVELGVKSLSRGL